MSNVILFPGMTETQQAQIGLDCLRDDYGDPEPTRVRRENLALVGATPNPAPTLSPQAMRRVRHDLQAGRQTSHEPDGPSAA